MFHRCIAARVLCGDGYLPRARRQGAFRQEAEAGGRVENQLLAADFVALARIKAADAYPHAGVFAHQHQVFTVYEKECGLALVELVETLRVVVVRVAARADGGGVRGKGTVCLVDILGRDAGGGLFEARRGLERGRDGVPLGIEGVEGRAEAAEDAKGRTAEEEIDVIPLFDSAVEFVGHRPEGQREFRFRKDTAPADGACGQVFDGERGGMDNLPDAAPDAGQAAVFYADKDAQGLRGVGGKVLFLIHGFSGVS